VVTEPRASAEPAGEPSFDAETDPLGLICATGGRR
jgi:hypothetical protein